MIFQNDAERFEFYEYVNSTECRKIRSDAFNNDLTALDALELCYKQYITENKLTNIQ